MLAELPYFRNLRKVSVGRLEGNTNTLGKNVSEVSLGFSMNFYEMLN